MWSLTVGCNRNSIVSRSPLSRVGTGDAFSSFPRTEQNGDARKPQRRGRIHNRSERSGDRRPAEATGIRDVLRQVVLAHGRRRDAQRSARYRASRGLGAYVVRGAADPTRRTLALHGAPAGAEVILVWPLKDPQASAGTCRIDRVVFGTTVEIEARRHARPRPRDRRATAAASDAANEQSQRRQAMNG